MHDSKAQGRWIGCDQIQKRRWIMNYTLLVAAHYVASAPRKMDAAAEQHYYESAASQVRKLEQVRAVFAASLLGLRQIPSFIGVFAAHVLHPLSNPSHNLSGTTRAS
jgi:hypothetical protein